MLNWQQNQQEDFLQGVAKGIAALFGSNCEVTVHDLTGDIESTIVIIENGHVTGRRLGDGASARVLQALHSAPAATSNEYNYLARTKDGRILKSSTIYLRNQQGVPVGLFGINYDITDLIMAQHSLQAAISSPQPSSEMQAGASTGGEICTNVTQLLEQLIAAADQHVAKPVALMGKDDKTAAIQFLDAKGAFLIKKASEKIAKHYHISKYTLYNYLGLSAEGGS